MGCSLRIPAIGNVTVHPIERKEKRQDKVDMNKDNDDDRKEQNTETETAKDQSQPNNDKNEVAEKEETTEALNENSDVAKTENSADWEEENAGPSKNKKTLYRDLLKKMNMDPYETKNLTLQDILQIDQECLEKMENWQRKSSAMNFIHKIIALNGTARSIITSSENESEDSQDEPDDVTCDSSDSVHPLDVLCLVLHCCDHFLQQEIILKMSMCQFAVPLLLPAVDGPGCTFMLWGMRDIVKSWRPQSLAETKGFMQENLVQISMPTFSFVRLGESKLSKSTILNQVLSPTQQTQDFFVHSNMEGADITREISEGLVEISWYFPAGKGNSDIFPEPVAFANLHGNLEDSLNEFGFLTQISSAVFIFVQDINKNLIDFLSQYENSQANFIIIFKESRKIDKDTGLTNVTVVHFNSKASGATIAKKIRAATTHFIKKGCRALSLEDMAEIAPKLRISVDENVIECQNAKADAKAIADEIKDVAEYKKDTMRLQRHLWKKAELEKEMCQMKKQGDKRTESYKSELQKQCAEIREKQFKYEIPNSISKFIHSVVKKNYTEISYFLKWLRFYLDLSARKNLSALQDEYKEKSNSSRINELSGLDHKISDSSLGTEHFLRELGQIYEAEHCKFKEENASERKFTELPAFAADLLLGGFPLELIDGDASNIPMQWLQDVMTELDNKTGKCSRMGVITVLGVQSTGKSTLLNTMFGLQFPVSSGRCTRGAFMTLMKVRKDFQEELGCEFILVIDTEGLKAPELASLKDSYEHDNELATLAVGLSDITIVNMAMENTTEMKDILQIVVHAFLRMKEIGRKPKCHFVHQNVSDVSAHENNRREWMNLLEQLNEMTRIAADMEKKTQFTAFSDIMMYDPEKDNFYIPGLWNGVPPMASINIAYSETIYELKTYLIECMKNKGHRICDFIKWIESLWNAVKYENFIFSFKNSLVANAYNQLAKKYSELEWKFTKAMLKWLAETETVIKNQNAQTIDSEGATCKYAAYSILSMEEESMKKELEKYFSSDNKDASLVERYKAEFLTSASCLRKKLEASSLSKCDEAIRIQKENLKVKKVISAYKEIIDKKVTSLVMKCREQKYKPDEKTLEEEFELMWADTISELNVTALPEPNIELDFLTLLKKDMASKAVSQRLNNINQLPKQEKLHVHESMGKNLLKKFKNKLPFLSSGPDKLEVFVKSFSDICSDFIKEKLSTESDYNETYGLELLHLINLVCDGNNDLQFTADIELDLKLFILGNAVCDFQQMHKDFVKNNDPLICLGELKTKYCNSFQYLFLEKDESWERAKHLCNFWLKPALIEQVNRKLGLEIVDQILDNNESNQYSTRGYFQFTVMKQLLEKSNFSDYLEYIDDYETFVKKWIHNCILEKCDFHHLQSGILSTIRKKITGFLNEPRTLQFQKMSDFLVRLREVLRNDLALSDDINVFCLKDEANIQEFVENIEKSLSDTEAEIIAELKSVDKETILSKVVVKPVDELFKRVFGCGKQCPFCRVPCEAGGTDHKIHFASIHRPTGLGRYRSLFTQALCHDICTINVSGNKSFIAESQSSHPYKEYRAVFPDWDILPDQSFEASEYWKYVLKLFNEKFAEEYDSRPAEYPEEWNTITKAQAERCLNTAFADHSDNHTIKENKDECEGENKGTSRDKKTLYKDLLKKMNMDPYETKSLPLQDFLQIDKECLQRIDYYQRKSAAWNFIHKIIALNGTARDIITSSENESEDSQDDVTCDSFSYIHPLDVLCLVLHCCDHFLQQEIILKMSMCQFAVPLLLPAADGPGCTFMLWGMRDIVKRWRPQSLAEAKGYMQENLVQISMPTFSFVRLGESKLSKSTILNQVLSPTQQTQDFFVNSYMEGADVTREISEGLVEISWYFPAGKGNSDIFPEPVAFANLHGNLEDSLKEFAFLTQISSAVFIFVLNIDRNLFDFLSQYKNSKTNFVIIVKESRKIDEGTDLTNVTVLVFRSKVRGEIIGKRIRTTALDFIKKGCRALSLEDMAEIAPKLGISVDENVIECQNAKADAKAIADEIKDVAEYKKATMRLQGHLWKKAELEKEMCQMKKQGDKRTDSYKSELQKQCAEIREKQLNYEIPNSISKFIHSVVKKNYTEISYFLKWLRFYLDLSARKNLSVLQAEYKEKSVPASMSSKELSGLDQKISDSSLGIEHFLRELGQFYEAEHFMLKGENAGDRKFTQLPAFAADLLLGGFPLELIDGDASNIPMQWLQDVLTELDNKTGKCSRMGVITVLGVQSTGKSTLLNTMFGLQFPVSSGRCTRGAFMTLMKVRKDFQEELGCEFILVIDTEGLKAPELASLKDSYEHDNELATLVVGLSDITIVNMAMENTTEMKDILQIVVHAFLRMKEIGRKPNCQFVHQNVSDVSAHENNRRGRLKLLEHLNKMTKTAANMEKKTEFTAFSDIMMYDPEKDNCYIPGLWNGVPPMASINIAYSETIYELKQHLIKRMKNKGHRIGDFIEWIESLWNAVKYENFIFSFRNSLVANAYNQLAKKYSELEWKFTKAMLKWLAETETVIKNQNAQTIDSEGAKCKYAAYSILSMEEESMKKELEKYFSIENKETSLVERYKAEFLTSASCLRKKLEASSLSKCDEAIRIQKENLKVKKVISAYKEIIDKKVTSLVMKCREQKYKPDEKTLQTEFELMWADTISELNFTALPEPNIELDFLTLLKKDMASKGSAVSQRLNNINQLPKQEKLHVHESMGKNLLKIVKNNLPFLSRPSGPDNREVFFKSLSDICSYYIKEKLSSESDYDETYGLEILNLINSVCDGNNDLQLTADIELDLKLFILGNAVCDFQQMHKDFVKNNDPLICLGEMKTKYCNSFQYLFLEKDGIWERAKHLCELWLKPALIEQVNRKLGLEIVDQILDNSESNQYSTRGYFQFNVMKHLLEKSNFSDYLEYIDDYETFVKKWIHNCILEKCDFHHLQSVILSTITKKITGFLNEPRTLQFQKMSDFLVYLREVLRNDLALSDDINVFCLKDEANIQEFVENLEKSLSDTEAEIISELKSVDKETILSNVVVKPVDELFKRVFGCGKQCPFCRVPCEAGGTDHKNHFASIHRPTGLGRYRSFFSQTLCHDICTTNVSGNKSFTAESQSSHLYKEYRAVYPDWNILPDPSIEASDYWKYVLKEFNDQFAEEYEGRPADYPEEWNTITKAQAERCLNTAFGI
uniref:Uncharacterized LOC100490671 n=1 Tax=Xenopus tropicalis TaxID=8364 RepID=A0A803JUF1_XENTR